MILVTGSSGLLGSHLLFDLVNRDEEIRAVVRSDKSINHIEKVFSWYSPQFTILLKKINFVKADLLDFDEIAEVAKGVSKVYHTAAIVSYKKNERKKIISENAAMAKNIVNACQKNNVSLLCHISSIASLGDQETPIKEETSYEISGRNSAYSTGKFKAELEVWRGIAEGLNAIILNPSVIIGPGDWNRSSCALFKTVSKGLKFYTEGTTGFVDVRDVSKCAIELTEGNAVNKKFIVSSENIGYKELFTLMALSLGKKPPFIKVNPALSELVCALEQIRTTFTGKSPVITKETARISQKKLLYSNDLVVKETGIKFIPVKEAIKHTAEIFLKEI